jgi:hypothetical protein
MNADKTNPRQGEQMSVAGYLGKNVKAPRIPREDDKEAREPKKLERERETQPYESVEDYDPVLRIS